MFRSNSRILVNQYFLKGELKRFFLSAQNFYRPQTKTSFKRQFSPKSPKVGQKSGQRVQNWPNKNQVASDLLRESTDSVIRAAEGIHQFCHPTYWGNPLVDNLGIRPAEGIHRFCLRSYWGNPSILSSDLLRESTRVYISYRWPSFNYNNTFRTSSLQPPSSWNPCSCHLPQGTSLEFWPLKKRRCKMWKW